MIVEEGIVGKKGEIYIKKKVRELLGLKPGDKIEIIITDKGAIIRKKKTPLDLLKEKKVKLSIEEELKLREEFEKEMKEVE